MTENQLKFLQYQESVRHNSAMEEVSQNTLTETERSNRAKEKETKSHNFAMEQLQKEKQNVDKWLGIFNTASNVMSDIFSAGNESVRTVLSPITALAKLF